MKVICLEGCHCVGKTELCEAFRSMGYIVQDEAFVDMPAYSLHPQSLMMETNWVCNWFSRILKTEYEIRNSKENGLGKDVIIIADRSPYSAIFYCQNPQARLLLEPLIQAQIKELRQNTGIDIVTVHITVEPEILWSRIQSRVLLEPFRRNLNEDKREWMETVVNIYRNFHWDFTFDNTKDHYESLNQVAKNLLAQIQSRNISSLEAQTILNGSAKTVSTI